MPTLFLFFQDLLKSTVKKIEFKIYAFFIFMVKKQLLRHCVKYKNIRVVGVNLVQLWEAPIVALHLGSNLPLSSISPNKWSNIIQAFSRLHYFKTTRSGLSQKMDTAGHRIVWKQMRQTQNSAGMKLVIHHTLSLKLSLLNIQSLASNNMSQHNNHILIP